MNSYPMLVFENDLNEHIVVPLCNHSVIAVKVATKKDEYNIFVYETLSNKCYYSPKPFVSFVHKSTMSTNIAKEWIKEHIKYF